MTNFTKNSLRQHYRQIRDQLPNRAQKSRLICQEIQSLPEIVDASTILLYISFGSEVDTSDLIQRFLGQKCIAAPKIVNKSMKFHALTSFSNLAPGHFGILEPQNTPKITNFAHTVAIVPALCYNRQGYRLGYGGGFYDKFLANHPEIPTIGLCFAACLTDQSFQDAHDIKIDRVITENS